MQKLLIAFFLLYSCTQIKAQNPNLFERQLFIEGKDTLPCRILTPLNYSRSKKYPLVIFMHGAGERGNDNESQLKWGGHLFLDSANRVKYPAIVIFPQCPKDSSWSNVVRGSAKDSLGEYTAVSDRPLRKSMELLLNFIDTLVKNGNVDKERIYVGGLSMGGFGTFEILWRRPDLFAAAIAICGGGVPQQVNLYYKKLPIWVFHGDKDPVIPVSNSRLMVGALEQANVKVKYTEYPGVNHDSWNNAFVEPDLLSWLFSQRKR